MGATLEKPRSSDPVRLPETIGSRPVKAGLRSDLTGLGTEVFDALVSCCGSVKALAYSLGEADPSLVRREIKEHVNFERIERDGSNDLKAIVADVVQRHWGRLTNPAARGRDLTRSLRRVADELDQLLEHIA